MPILDLQQRIRELGRIRIGQQVPTGRGGTRPAKLDKFRLTSASRPLLEKVAAAYGGTVQEWTPKGGAQQWEVFTDAQRLPILVPPQPVSQWYELWSGGGCQRRCDGEREIIKETPCLCSLADERLCKPTTRLNVVLKDIEGIGVFRLESHGFYAATELPQVASFLEQSGGYVSAHLILEERVVNRVGEPTKRFMVPAIEIEGVTPGQLVSGQVIRPQVAAGSAPAAVTGAAPAAIAAPQVNFVELIGKATSRDAVLEIWEQAKAAGAPAGPVEAAAQARVKELAAQQTPPAAEAAPMASTPDTHIKAALGAHTTDALSAALKTAQTAGYATNLGDQADPVAQAFVARRRLLLADAEAAFAPDPPDAPPVPQQTQGADALWAQIVAVHPADQTSAIEQEISERFGVPPSQATADQLATFLTELNARPNGQALAAVPASAPADATPTPF